MNATGEGRILAGLRRGRVQPVHEVPAPGWGDYIDVGAADLVASGQVKLVLASVDHLSEDAVVLEDGTELPTDQVVYATGYRSMNGWAADLISQEVADKVGKVWDLARTRPKTRGRGRASRATCGSRPSRKGCGS